MTGPAAQSPNVGVNISFDFSGSPEQLANIQEQAARFIEGLGGTSVRQAIGEPEVKTGDTEALLDGSLEWLLASLPESSRHAPRRTFKQDGIICARDVLMIGSRMLLRQFDGVGEKAIGSIQSSISRELPLVPFKTDPKIEDIAALCSRPDQIPLQAVIRSSLRFLWIGPEPPSRRVTLDDALNYTTVFQYLRTRRDLIAPTQEFYARLARLKGWPQRSS